MRLKIKVTKEILRKSYCCPSLADLDPYDDEGRSYLRNNCAIAHAVKELFPQAVVHVYSMQFMPKTDGIRLPSNMSAYINHFDKLSHEERLNMPEAEFEVDVPDQVINKIDISQVIEIISRSLTLEIL